MEPDGVDASRLAVLEAIGRPADLTLVSLARTMADELSVAGARELLRGRDHRELELAALPGAAGDVVLLAGGGDDGSAAGGGDQTARALGVAALRFRRVVVAPMSASAHDDELLGALAGTRATVFASDPASLALIAALCDARLAHDCAFHFDFGAHMRALGGAGVTRPGASAHDLDGWLAALAAHEPVRTDRPREMIAAALLGRRVEYPASGGDERLEWTARHALAGFPVSPVAADGDGDARPAPLALEADGAATLAVLESAARDMPPPRRGDHGRVSAIVLTRDRPRLARRALDSLERAGVLADVLVIDQNSTPANSRALAAECAARDGVRLHRCAHNLGCAGGRRLGAALTAGELVLFLDDDAELLPGALDHLLAALDADPRVGAVTATVVTPDGVVAHSGGSFEVGRDVATFELIGSGLAFAPGALPPSGPADWVAGTALLARRELLEAFPLDTGMAAYYEDNEWSLRVRRARGRTFARCAEALVLHQLTPKRPDGPSFAARSLAVELLAAQARFYQRHGVLLGPWLFHLVPELTARDGSRDLACARLLMELIGARGTDWFMTSWMNGELDGLISAHRRATDLAATQATLDETRGQLDVTWRVLTSARRELDAANAELRRLAREIASRDETIAWLHNRHETLAQIEEGGWWRLRARLLPIVRLAGRLRPPRR